MNETAFPIPSGWNHEGKWVQDSCSSNGMTLRDYFAAKAMQEFCKEFDDDAHIAKVAYKIADAMMEARNAAQ